MERPSEEQAIMMDSIAIADLAGKMIGAFTMVRRKKDNHESSNVVYDLLETIERIVSVALDEGKANGTHPNYALEKLSGAENTLKYAIEYFQYQKGLLKDAK